MCDIHCHKLSDESSKRELDPFLEERPFVAYWPKWLNGTSRDSMLLNTGCWGPGLPSYNDCGLEASGWSLWTWGAGLCSDPARPMVLYSMLYNILVLLVKTHHCS